MAASLSRATRMFPSERHVGSSTLECFLTPHLPLRFYDTAESSILAARRHSELLPYLGRKQRFSPCTYCTCPRLFLLRIAPLVWSIADAVHVLQVVRQLQQWLYNDTNRPVRLTGGRSWDLEEWDWHTLARRANPSVVITSYHHYSCCLHLPYVTFGSVGSSVRPRGRGRILLKPRLTVGWCEWANQVLGRFAYCAGRFRAVQ
jgi:hypothetical protein